ncbi:hypothetical protein PENTCL1PPCAC_22226, partial [Pristionchus entomophagus]
LLQRPSRTLLQLLLQLLHIRRRLRRLQPVQLLLQKQSPSLLWLRRDPPADEAEKEQRPSLRRPATRHVQCTLHVSNHVESTWSAVVAELNEDNDGEMTASTVLMLTHLYKVCCGSLSSLIRDASHSLKNSTGLAKVFSRAQDDVIRVADCPYIFVTARFLHSSPLLQRLQLSMYEQQGHFETFCEQKEKCIRELNALKSAQKLSAIGGSTGSSTAMTLANGELNLAKALLKLFFQLLIMFDSFNDILRNVKESPGAAEHSLSPAVLMLQRELLCSMAADSLNNMSGTSHPSSSLSAASERPTNHLLLMIANKQHAAAIGALRQLRIQEKYVPTCNGSGVDLGCCEQTDIDVLLLLFCHSHTTLRAWALAGGDQTALKVPTLPSIPLVPLVVWQQQEHPR